MIWAVLLLLFAQQRQVELTEQQLGLCPPSSAGAALPESTLCWQHVPRGFYEVEPGLLLEAGVDGYRAYEDGGTERPDIPCSIRTYEDSSGVMNIRWVCTTSFSIIKNTRFPYVSGETHQWCVQSYTDDISTQRVYSRPTCLDVSWARCLDGDALGAQCPLMELP